MEKWNSYKALAWIVFILLAIISLTISLWLNLLGKIDWIAPLDWTILCLIGLSLGAKNTKPIIERDKTQTDPQKGPLSQ